MSEQRPLHRLFGLSWTDFCDHSALNVTPEKDLSVRQQFLDLLLSRQGPGPLPQPLPDGFDDLGDYNVVTFKSHQEALDGFALCELVCHYVNTRKQCSPSLKNLLAEGSFRLYAVCVRYPHNLAQQIGLTRLRAGVYEVPLLSKRIRLIVVQELPHEQQNALSVAVQRPQGAGTIWQGALQAAHQRDDHPVLRSVQDLQRGSRYVRDTQGILSPEAQGTAC